MKLINNFKIIFFLVTFLIFVNLQEMFKLNIADVKSTQILVKSQSQNSLGKLIVRVKNRFVFSF